MPAVMSFTLWLHPELLASEQWGFIFWLWEEEYTLENEIYVVYLWQLCIICCFSYCTHHVCHIWWYNSRNRNFHGHDWNAQHILQGSLRQARQALGPPCSIEWEKPRPIAWNIPLMIVGVFCIGTRTAPLSYSKKFLVGSSICWKPELKKSRVRPPASNLSSFSKTTCTRLWIGDDA